MRRGIILSACLLVSCLMMKAQKITHDPDSIRNRLLEQLALYPQEKIHLHLDRDIYVPGEKIWFKAYLVEASTHWAINNSRYIYVELIAADSLVSRVMIRPENNLYYGHIPITEMLPEGDYTIRAYTRYMENMGEDYFFKKVIRIGEIETADEEKEPKSKKKKNADKQKDDFDVSFFPEGGNLLEGTLCNVGFKALNSKGLSETITGTLIDEEGMAITPVGTLYAGMGRLAYIPEKGKTYYLECTNTQGKTKKFELPKAHSDAYSLMSVWRGDKLYIALKKSAKMSDIPAYLLLHCRGDVIYYNSWEKGRYFIVFNKEDLPAGVIQAVLFDNQLNPLSERLVFCKNEEPVNISFLTDKENYDVRDLVSSRLAVTGKDGLPLNSNLSVSITDDKDIAVDESFTIFSNLLLSSELKGYIETPGYYFSGNDMKTEIALDNLMLTQGWRRYNIPEAIKGKIETPKIPFEIGQVINGTVKTPLLSKPVIDGQVTVFVSAGDFAMTETDEKGRFSFTEFEYPDSTTYFLQSIGKKGRRSIILDIEKKPFPEPRYIPQKQDTPAGEEICAVKATESAFIEKAGQRSKYDEEMRVIHLKNIDVVASKIDKKEKDRPWYTSGSDVTINREAIERRNPTYVKDLLYGIPGVQVSPNGYITIRGVNSIHGSSFPLILIDGMSFGPPEQMNSPFDSPLEMVSVHDIERIDVFKGASAALFGMRGASGVISITTRRGEGGSSDREALNTTALFPLGYQQPVEFYSPKYDTPESKYTGNPDYRTTIFWKPDIVTSEKGEAAFQFYTADFHTTYSVVIEGLTSEGHIIRKVEKIKVE